MTSLTARQSEWLHRMWYLLMQIWDVLTQSVIDIALTVGALGAAVSIYMTYWPSRLPWAVFVTGSVYFILVCMRILRRIHENKWGYHTVNEVGETLLAMDHQIAKRLDMIAHNMAGPYPLDDEDAAVLVKLSHDA